MVAQGGVINIVNGLSQFSDITNDLPSYFVNNSKPDCVELQKFIADPVEKWYRNQTDIH